MKIKLKNELVFLNILVVALISIISFIPSNISRILLTLPFLLFIPGYVLVVALFPRKTEIDGIERIALSFGASIVTVPLIGFILNYTHWGVSLSPVLYSVSLFVLVASIAAEVRRRKSKEQERFFVEFDFPPFYWSGSAFNIIFSVVLILSILGATAAFGYVAVHFTPEEKFSEFYILGANGKAADYPGEIKIGEIANVTVGIVNHEQKTSNYRVEVRINGVPNGEVRLLTLNNEAKWEDTLSFRPYSVGDNQKVEFLMYKDNESEYCLETHLWINVKN